LIVCVSYVNYCSRTTEPKGLSPSAKHVAAHGTGNTEFDKTIPSYSITRHQSTIGIDCHPRRIVNRPFYPVATAPVTFSLAAIVIYALWRCATII
jgi:hypothetical protein